MRRSHISRAIRVRYGLDLFTKDDMSSLESQIGTSFLCQGGDLLLLFNYSQIETRCLRLRDDLLSIKTVYSDRV